LSSLPSWPTPSLLGWAYTSLLGTGRALAKIGLPHSHKCSDRGEPHSGKPRWCPPHPPPPFASCKSSSGRPPQGLLKVRSLDTRPDPPVSGLLAHRPQPLLPLRAGSHSRLLCFFALTNGSTTTMHSRTKTSRMKAHLTLRCFPGSCSTVVVFLTPLRTGSMFPISVYFDCLRILTTTLLLKLRMKALSAIRTPGKS
jgi:hypothetical protein